MYSVSNTNATNVLSLVFVAIKTLFYIQTKMAKQKKATPEKSANSDENAVSTCSNVQVMRIKEMITNNKMSY